MRDKTTRKKLKSFIVNLLELSVPLYCKICDNHYDTNEDFAFHSRVHNEDLHYSCHLCEFQCDSKKAIKAHVLNHNVFKCEPCGKIFKFKHGAYRHAEIHLDQNTVQCEVCGKSLQRQSLNTHMKLLHSAEFSGTLFECPICKKVYKYNCSLKKHISFNHRELGIDVSVVCDICGRRISSKSKLQQHLKIHSGEKPFSCTFCDKQFRSKDTMKSHMVVHTGEKPYICGYCGKKFGQSAPYRYHIKTHTGEKSYSCSICGKGFISKANWRLHVKTCDILSSNKNKFH